MVVGLASVLCAVCHPAIGACDRVPLAGIGVLTRAPSRGAVATPAVGVLRGTVAAWGAIAALWAITATATVVLVILRVCKQVGLGGGGGKR